LATYHGDLSSVGFGGEKNEITYTNAIAFSAGLSRKKYLVLLSSRPVVWHLENTPAQVSQVVVVGPTGRFDKAVHAGVLGVDSQKVSFVPLECFPKASEEVTHASAQFEATQAHLKAYLSHESVIVKEIQKYERAEIADGKVYIQTRPVENTLLPGFDPRIWRDHIEKGRDRLRIFDPKETAQIISLGKVAPYAVYPMAFGLAQLVHQGVLEPVENGTAMTLIFDSQGREMTRITSVEKITFAKRKQGSGGQAKEAVKGAQVIRGYDYKIVKPLVAYPQDVSFFLDGKFILTKNGALPEGRAPFCIVEEETGKPVEMSACR
ncbi:MAG TPA: hypothetical protein VHP34_04170, partial [Alphaproteobacteria bacterium]|nr:hypothetical protein [Alphaproteobacteria bacterium]